MDFFFGTKQIKAKPMTQEAFAQHIGVSQPSNMPDRSPKGYLVEYLDGGDPNHKDHDGYISWSPKDVFERAYQPVTTMSFGHAMEAMRLGHTVTRTGWNGKDMFLYLVKAESSYGNSNTHPAIRERFANDSVVRREFIMMLTAQNDVVPWSIAMSDVLANDWCIVK